MSARQFPMSTRAGRSWVEDVAIVPLPPNGGGVVIGRGGATIRDIQQRSGARVSVESAHGAGGGRGRGRSAGSSSGRGEEQVARVSGDAEAVRDAVRIIQDLLVMTFDGGRYVGHGRPVKAAVLLDREDLFSGPPKRIVYRRCPPEFANVNTHSMRREECEIRVEASGGAGADSELENVTERAACLGLRSPSSAFLLKMHLEDTLADFKACLRRLMVEEPCQGRMKVVVRFGQQLVYAQDTNASLNGRTVNPSTWCRQRNSTDSLGGVRTSFVNLLSKDQVQDLRGFLADPECGFRCFDDPERLGAKELKRSLTMHYALDGQKRKVTLRWDAERGLWEPRKGGREATKEWLLALVTGDALLDTRLILTTSEASDTEADIDPEIRSFVRSFQPSAPHPSGTATGPDELSVPQLAEGGRLKIDTCRFKRRRRHTDGVFKVSETDAQPGASAPGRPYGSPTVEIALTRMDWRDAFRNRAWLGGEDTGAGAGAGAGLLCYELVANNVEGVLEMGRRISRAAGPHRLNTVM